MTRFEQLLKGLKEGNQTVRSLSAHTLGEFGASAEFAIPDLLAVLWDPRSRLSLQCDVAIALGHIGPAAQSALIAALGNENPRVREKSVWAITLIEASNPEESWWENDALGG